MIEMITGLPGAGKSYGAHLRLMTCLERSDKFIVTNTAVKMDELNAYYNDLARTTGRPLIDVFARVRIITTDEAREFWRFRGAFTVLADRPRKRQRTLKALNEKHDDLTEPDDKPNTAQVVDIVNDWAIDCGVFWPGVFYIIEEAHLLFDARSWQATSACLTFYNSQHRKFRDDCIFVTQFLKMIELRVKGFAENFYVYRNFAGRKVYQVLKMPNRMRELKYGMDPSSPGAMADEETWRTLDKKRAATYDTMRGVGIGGGREPEKRIVSGFSIPWWSPLVGLVLAGILFVTGSKWFAEKGLTSFVKTPGAEVKPAQQQPPARRREPVEQPPSRPQAPPASEPLPVATAPPPVVTGTAIGKGQIMVMLSNGQTLRGPDLRSVDEDKAVTRDGVVLWKQRTTPPRVTPALPARTVPRGTMKPQA